ncbi:hypothetical protein HY375_03330 [Candidatus Berkelbacteria bacterium]|nr:hypothetical protein [Candidatus Berkelbacteria bacterium]
MKPTLLVLAGPTASGKSGWALRFAKEHRGAIIAADSRTVYRELNLGAGKVTTEHPATWRTGASGPIATIEGIDHYGLNLVGLGDRFTVADFQDYVYRLLPDLWRHGLQPILVGGTGLYVSAVIEGYTFSGRGGRTSQTPAFPAQVFVIDRPRTELYARIDARLEERLDAGLLTEVVSLMEGGHTKRLLALGLEYRVLTEYLLGDHSPEQLSAAVAKLSGQIHAYARRQLTWWRHHGSVRWISGYTEFVERAEQAVRE